MCSKRLIARPTYPIAYRRSKYACSPILEVSAEHILHEHEYGHPKSWLKAESTPVRLGNVVSVTWTFIFKRQNFETCRPCPIRRCCGSEVTSGLETAVVTFSTALCDGFDRRIAQFSLSLATRRKEKHKNLSQRNFYEKGRPELDKKFVSSAVDVGIQVTNFYSSMHNTIPQVKYRQSCQIQPSWLNRTGKAFILRTCSTNRLPICHLLTRRGLHA